VIDWEILRREIEKAIGDFTQGMGGAWFEARRGYFLDLRVDPRPWDAPVRAANTNGTILLDRYACLLTPQGVRELGLGLAITWVLMGVVTEDSELFRAGSAGHPVSSHVDSGDG
jgi:hypothetical protein